MCFFLLSEVNKINAYQSIEQYLSSSNDTDEFYFEKKYIDLGMVLNLYQIY